MLEESADAKRNGDTEDVIIFFTDLDNALYLAPAVTCRQSVT